MKKKKKKTPSLPDQKLLGNIITIHEEEEEKKKKMKNKIIKKMNAQRHRNVYKRIVKKKKKKRTNKLKKKKLNWIPPQYWKKRIDEQIQYWYNHIQNFCKRFRLDLKTEEDYFKLLSAFIHPSALKYYPENFDPGVQDYKLYEQHGDKVLAYYISSYHLKEVQGGGRTTRKLREFHKINQVKNSNLHLRKFAQKYGFPRMIIGVIDEKTNFNSKVNADVVESIIGILCSLNYTDAVKDITRRIYDFEL